MKDSIGPEGIVPPTLVLGEHPQVFTPSEEPPDRLHLNDRAKLSESARLEMEYAMSKLRLTHDLKHSVPKTVEISYKPNQKVLVWREKQIDNRIGEWLGPWEVVSCDPDKKLV